MIDTHVATASATVKLLITEIAQLKCSVKAINCVHIQCRYIANQDCMQIITKG